MDDNLQTIGQRLKFARLMNTNLNQEQISAKIGRSSTVYGQYERDRNEMSMATITELCNILKIRMEWLLTGKGPMSVDETDFIELLYKPDHKAILDDVKSLVIKRILGGEN